MSLLGWIPSVAITETSAGIVVRSDRASFHLKGPDARAFVDEVAPLLDGTRDRAAIQAALGAYSPQSIGALIDALVKRGLVKEAFGEDRPSPLAALRIRMAGSAPFVDVAMEAIRASGARDVARAEREGIEGAAILVAGFGERDREARIRTADLAHRKGVVSLWAEAHGSTVVLGPLVLPAETACRACVDAGSERRRRGIRPPRYAHEILGNLVASAAIEALTSREPSRLGGRVLVQDLRTWESSWRTLVRLPWCPVCG